MAQVPRDPRSLSQKKGVRRKKRNPNQPPGVRLGTGQQVPEEGDRDYPSPSSPPARNSRSTMQNCPINLFGFVLLSLSSFARSHPISNNCEGIGEKQMSLASREEMMNALYYQW